QYSLGCVLYFCLTGQYPFSQGSAVEKITSHLHKQPTPIKKLAPDVPDALVEVIERLMQKNPGDRYPGCAELLEVLRPLRAGLDSGSQGTLTRFPRVHEKPSPPVPSPMQQGEGSKTPARSASEGKSQAGKPDLRQDISEGPPPTPVDVAQTLPVRG